MSKGLTEAAEGYLKGNPSQWYTTREIADWIMEEYPEIVSRMCKMNPKNMHLPYRRRQMTSEIGSALRNRVEKGVVSRTVEKPYKYCWGDKPTGIGMRESAPPPSHPPSKSRPVSAHKVSSRKEQELYLPLRRYLDSREIGSQRIDEKAATNKRGRKGNIWLYPDVVGMEILSQEWDPDVNEIVTVNADRKARFWSFEVKVELSVSSVREAYFQAVSNSSWANFGYLVAEKVGDESTLMELRMLFSLHGIGVIELNVENPKESRIVIPARERLNVDWANCDRVVKANRSFKEFIERAMRNLKAGKYSSGMWDSLL